MPKNPDGNLLDLWTMIEISTSKSDAKYKFTGLHKSMFHSTADSFPYLKGRAAQIRHVGPALLRAFEHYMDADNQVHRWVRLGIKASIQMETILNSCENEWKVPAPLDSKLVASGFAFLACQNALREHFGVHRRIFHVTIKSHVLMHACMMAKYLHPRRTWCYSGEDFISRIAKIIMKSNRGTPLRFVVDRTMHKYARGLLSELLEQAGIEE